MICPKDLENPWAVWSYRNVVEEFPLWKDLNILSNLWSWAIMTLKTEGR